MDVIKIYHVISAGMASSRPIVIQILKSFFCSALLRYGRAQEFINKYTFIDEKKKILPQVMIRTVRTSNNFTTK